jgi:hypothetical protein
LRKGRLRLTHHLWGGSDVFLPGGVGTFIACSMFAVVPGFINSWSHEVGGSVLILGGTVTFTLVNFMTTQVRGWGA